jgi:hypothetical protein
MMVEALRDPAKLRWWLREGGDARARLLWWQPGQFSGKSHRMARQATTALSR